jgi:hypothetical protein
MKTLTYFILTLFFLIAGSNLFSQTVDIDSLKAKGRDSIIAFSIRYLQQNNVFDLPEEPENIRVMANNTEVYVLFNMGFFYNESEDQLENYDLRVSISKSSVSIAPYQYGAHLKAYTLTDQQKKTVHFIMKDQSCPFEEDERIRITEGKDYYEMICSRGIEKGAESYVIDKKTGERSMAWHEMPQPSRNDYSISDEDPFVEIK